MPTEVFFSDANAASLPQSQVAAMSKTHLMQSVTVLQAGWTSAVKRLNDVTRNRETDDAALREEIAASRGAVATMEAKAHAQEEAINAQRRRIFELETEVAQYRRAQREDTKHPEVARLNDELIQTKGRLLEVERLLRQREPLNVQFMKIRLDEFTRQREQDKVRLQENALAIARLEQQLRDAQESEAMSQSQSTQPSSPITTVPDKEKRGSRWDFVISNTNALASRVGPSRNAATTDTKPPVSVQDVSVQATLNTIKTLDLIEEKNRQIEDAILAREAAEETVEALQAEIKALTESNELLLASEQRKEELLARLAQAPVGGGASIETLIRLEDERVNLTERLRRAETAQWQTEERCKAVEARAVQLEADLNRVTRSFAAVAEENVQLSHSLQAVGAMSTQELASTLTAGDRLAKLKTELAQCQEMLEKERVNQTELSRLSRENGILHARVDKYQQELAAVISDNSRLAAEIQRLQLSPSPPRATPRADLSPTPQELASFNASVTRDD